MTIRENPYIPHKPTAKQEKFLSLDELEALYGGAAGGGKTDALLMGALQYIQVPGYSALLLRLTSPQLNLPEGLIPRAHEWLGPTDAVWSEKRSQWTVPDGGLLTFGHCEHEIDKYRYQGSAYQFVGFDELTSYTESKFRFLFSRLRRLKGSSIPLRMRAGSNPGGEGHDWVKMRFIDPGDPKRPFIPARLHDNPFIDQEEYIESLMHLSPVERAQLLRGDWSARQEGSMFKREWFEYVDSLE